MAAARERQSHVRHELRAPLAVIYPLLSLLLDGGAGELSPQQREFLEVLERNVVRLEALITGVADSGWADCSPAPSVPGEVALGDVVEEVVALRLSGRSRRTAGRRRRPGRRPRGARGRTATTCARSSPTSCATL